MKKIFISFVALMATMSLSAQTIVIYKVNKADNTESVADAYTNTSTYTYRAEFTNNSKHEFVDLGLPSGTLWARKNVGAEKETDTGLYFAWGETTGYAAGSHSFDWANYKWMTSGMASQEGVTKYTSSYDITANAVWWDDGSYIGSTVDGVKYEDLTTLQSCDDAAVFNNGSNWCMASVENFRELVDNTNFVWTSIDGVKGCKFINKSDPSLYVFFPASGHCEGTECINLGDNVNLWTPLVMPIRCYQASFVSLSDGYDGSNLPFAEMDRCFGMPVRAVYSKSK